MLNSKNDLRRQLKARRLSMDSEAKSKADSLICRAVLDTPEYQSCEDLLVYVSSSIEVGTYELIERALKDGKNVFAPRCVKGTNIMHFFRIGSFDDLEPGYFGILEPKEGQSEYLPGRRGVVITPALAYDRDGYRIGFGKGFYDRFLSGFGGVAVGICYDSFILDNVFRESFDAAVDIIITDKRKLIVNERNDHKNG